MRSTLNRFWAAPSLAYTRIDRLCLQIVKIYRFTDFRRLCEECVCVFMCVSVTVKFSIFTTFTKTIKYRANEWWKKYDAIEGAGKVLQCNLPVQLYNGGGSCSFNFILLHLYHHAVVILYMTMCNIQCSFNINHDTLFYFDFVLFYSFRFCSVFRTKCIITLITTIY